jgi:phosphonate transport system ATP-binding protein
VTIRLSGVGLSHANGQVALSAIDLQVTAGERLAIIGPSGAGKTSLLRLLATALQPGSGSLELLGTQPWQLSADSANACAGASA